MPCGALPRVLRAVEARAGRLRRPVERDARTQHVACRPLHVGAQRAGRRVHEKYTAGDRTCHVVLLNGLEVRLPQRPQSRTQDYACWLHASRGVLGHSMPDEPPADASDAADPLTSCRGWRASPSCARTARAGRGRASRRGGRTSCWRQRAMSSVPSTTTSLPSRSVPTTRAYQARCVGYQRPGTDRQPSSPSWYSSSDSSTIDGVEHVADLVVDVPGERPQADADLVGGQPGAPLGVDGLQQVLDEAADPVVDRRDRVARGAQDGVADGPDLSHRHAPILARPTGRRGEDEPPAAPVRAQCEQNDTGSPARGPRRTPCTPRPASERVRARCSPRCTEPPGGGPRCRPTDHATACTPRSGACARCWSASPAWRTDA